MTTQTPAEAFADLKTLAVIGVSRKKKFGNFIYNELKSRGYDVYPVNPHMQSFDGAPCYSSLSDAPDDIEAAVICVSRDRVMDALRDASAKGIKRVWIQQGAGSDEAKAFCAEQGLEAVFGQCILMYARPVGGIHGFHRWLWKRLGLAA